MEEVDLAKVADNTIGGGDFYTLKGKQARKQASVPASVGSLSRTDWADDWLPG